MHSRISCDRNVVLYSRHSSWKRGGSFIKAINTRVPNSPKDGRFDRVIELPYASAKLIPKVFVWYPMRHNDVTIFCPHHGCPLRAARWADKLDDSRAHPRNPRLINDLNGNLILVQAYYECSLLLSGNEAPRHRYLLASAEVMSQLPPHIVRLFPLFCSSGVELHFACMIT